MADVGVAGTEDGLLAEVRSLRAEVERLRAEVRRLHADPPELPTADVTASGATPAREGDGPSPTFLSRRGMILSGLGAVAGAAAFEVAGAGPAAATAGAMQYGLSNDASAASTGLTSTASDWTYLVRNTGAGAGSVGTASSGFGVRGDTSGSGQTAAGVRGNADGISAYGVHGVSDRGCGVRGDTSSPAWPGVWGVGVGNGMGVAGVCGGVGDTGARGVHCESLDGFGVEAESTNGPGLKARSKNAAALHLQPWQPFLNLSATYSVGSVFVTTAGEAWFCVEAGTPGKWRLLASPGSAGAFVPITPVRVYDSRWTGVPGVTTGLLTLGGPPRTVSVAASRTNTGAVIDANAIPAGATALTVNLTITATQGSGNLALVPGGVASSTTSSINWTASGQAFANGLTVPIRASDRTVNLLCNGNATQALLDVTGYFLGK